MLCEALPGDLDPRVQQVRDRRHVLDLGFGRIVALEKEAPNMLANLV